MEPRIFCATALLLICSVHGAERRTLSYSEAVRLGLANAPELKISESEVRRSNVERQDASHFFPSNPDLDATYISGNKTRSPVVGFSPSTFLKDENPFDLPIEGITGKNRQPLHGFEIGITQELDLWGKQSARREGADAAIRQAAANDEITRLQIRAEIRANLMTVASLGETIQSNSATLAHLRRIRGASAGFVDPRMGYYAGTAFKSDLAGIEADTRELIETRDKALLSLHRMLGVKDEFEAPAPGAIPLAAPETLEHLLKLAHEKNPERRAAELALARAETNERFALLADLPNPSLFLGAGQTTIGGSNMGVRGPGPENERETTVRFGAKISLPIQKYSQGQLEAARTEKLKAKMELEKIDSALDLTVKQTYERYTALRNTIRELGTATDAGANLAVIDQAFLAGRISYFDFMSEYERTAKVLKRRSDSYIGAATACGTLELLTGQTMDQEPKE
ncbi:MAG: TolC family protein [Spirochaetia bacterium]|nr:TolC family protein [Spirochaetia bacterium]